VLAGESMAISISMPITILVAVAIFLGVRARTISEEGRLNCRRACNVAGDREWLLFMDGTCLGISRQGILK